MARHPAPSLRSGMLAASSGFLGPSSFPNRPRTSHDGVSQRFVQLSRVRRERRTVQSLVDTHDKSDVVRKNVELHDETVLDSIKWNEAGLVTVIVQDVDTGEILMQAYADPAGIKESLQTGLATFYSRSRKERWCKGETSGNFIAVKGIYLDCDRDSVIYLGEPRGPSCHTGAHTCWFSEVSVRDGAIREALDGESRNSSPLSSLLALEQTIEQRKADSTNPLGGKKSWTAKLLGNPELLCSKIMEEADELCQTLEEGEGKERAASEMADLLYHAMVLLNLQGVSCKDVGQVLRSRFGTSGIEEKQSRPPKE